MMQDHKGIAIILGKLAKKGKGEDASDESEDTDTSTDEASEYEAAADEVMTAIQEKDTKALAEALKSFFSMCSADGE